jgi:hypothetical protein
LNIEYIEYVFYGAELETTVPLAIVVYIDGSFVKHKIPFKPIYITLRNLNSVVSGKPAAWRVLGIMPTLRKSATWNRQTRGGRSAACGCIMQVSPT